MLPKGWAHSKEILAPTASNFFCSSSASSFFNPFFTTTGAPSTCWG